MFRPVLILSVVVLAVSAKSIEDASREEAETERIVGGKTATPGQFPWAIEDASREEAETERIVGGKTATPGQFPWAVALYYNNQFVCTGSILSQRTVLTAAHCVVFDGVEQPAESFYAIANVSKSAGSVRINFNRVVSHPEYQEENVNNDVAVFTTTEEIPFSDEVGPICIARPDTAINEYMKSKVTVMGWGNISPFRSIVRIPDRLQFVGQIIVPNRFCSYVNGGVNEDKLCASGGFMGVCNGDSGGPLVVLGKDQPPVQIGITSYINALVGCAKIVPAVYTRVSSFYDYIMQTSNDASICTV